MHTIGAKVSYAGCRLTSAAADPPPLALRRAAELYRYAAGAQALLG